MKEKLININKKQTNINQLNKNLSIITKKILNNKNKKIRFWRETIL